MAAKLDELGISYLLDQSIYEEHPLGRVEWVKLYAALWDLEEQADAVFDQHVTLVNNLPSESTGKTAAIF